jgi:hypothetical protein
MSIQNFPQTINSPNSKLNTVNLDDFALPSSGQLGTIANFVVTEQYQRLQKTIKSDNVRENVDTEEYRIIDKIRYKMLSTVRHSLHKYAKKKHRMSECHYSFAPNGKAPTIHYDTKICSSSWHNLKKCSNELCPVCAVRVGIETRKRLSRIMSEAYAQGYYCAMGTLTMQHDRRHFTDDNVQAQKQAWRKMTQDKAYRAILTKYGVVGYLLGTDQTFSFTNGVHFHFHIIFVIDPNTFNADDWTNDYDDESLWTQLADKWEYFVHAVGRDCVREYAVDLRVGDQYISDYIAKKGRAPKVDRWDITSELSLKTVKRAPDEHYTLYELMILAHAGDEWASVMYAQFCDAMKSQQRLSMSKFVRDLEKSLPEEAQPEEEARPEEEYHPDFVATFDSFRVARDTRNKRGDWLQLHQDKCFDELVQDVAQCHVQGVFEWSRRWVVGSASDGWQIVMNHQLHGDMQSIELGRVFVFDGKVTQVLVSQPLNSGLYGHFVHPEQSKLNVKKHLPAVKPSQLKLIDDVDI